MQFSAIKWFKNSSGELVAPLLISSCLLLVIVSALANHSDSDSKSYILAAQNIQYLKDANNEFTIEEIVLRQSKFTASEGIMNFGFINHSYWFKIDISKLHLTVPVDETLYYLKLAYPSVNLATLYYQTSNGS